MAIAGIGGAFRMYIPMSSAAKTTKTGDEAEFSKGVHVLAQVLKIRCFVTMPLCPMQVLKQENL